MVIRITLELPFLFSSVSGRASGDAIAASCGGAWTDRVGFRLDCRVGLGEEQGRHVRTFGFGKVLEAVSWVGSLEVVREKLWSVSPVFVKGLVIRNHSHSQSEVRLFCVWESGLGYKGIRMSTGRLWYGRTCNVLLMSFCFRFSYVRNERKQLEIH